MGMTWVLHLRLRCTSAWRSRGLVLAWLASHSKWLATPKKQLLDPLSLRWRALAAPLFHSSAPPPPPHHFTPSTQARENFPKKKEKIKEKSEEYKHKHNLLLLFQKLPRRPWWSRSSLDGIAVAGLGKGGRVGGAVVKALGGAPSIHVGAALLLSQGGWCASSPDVFSRSHMVRASCWPCLESTMLSGRSDKSLQFSLTDPTKLSSPASQKSGLRG